MKRLSGGIDVGSVSHHFTILDEEDHVLYNRTWQGDVSFVT